MQTSRLVFQKMGSHVDSRLMVTVTSDSDSFYSRSPKGEIGVGEETAAT